MKAAIAATCLVMAGMLAASPATAFDCTRAATPTEKAICANPEALQSDKVMSAAYFALRRKLSGPGRRLLLQNQKSWLARRNTSCISDTACLARENADRQETLAKTPAGMVPFSVIQALDKKRHLVEASINGYRFASPASAGERAYNAAIDHQIRKTPIGKTYDPSFYPTGGHETYEANIQVERLDRRIISSLISIYTYSGGAHPNSYSDAINLFRQTGKDINPVKLFSRRARHRLADLCARQIVKTYQQKIPARRALAYLNEQYPGAVAKHIATPARWHYTKTHAVVRFDSYAIGPYVQGPGTCRFKYQVLRKLSRSRSVF